MKHNRENWLPCHLSDTYEISDFGNVRNRKTNRHMKLHTDNYGYKKVCLFINSKRKMCLVHRLVLLSFKPEENFQDACVNHIDGNKFNNKLVNLEWCTYKQNMEHGQANDLFPKGEYKSSSKLKDSDIPNIRVSFEKYKNFSKVGRIFGVSDNTIRKIINGITWNHI